MPGAKCENRRDRELVFINYVFANSNSFDQIMLYMSVKSCSRGYKYVCLNLPVFSLWGFLMASYEVL